jgi:hypothetical protein
MNLIIGHRPFLLLAKSTVASNYQDVFLAAYSYPVYCHLPIRCAISLSVLSKPDPTHGEDSGTATVHPTWEREHRTNRGQYLFG